jgi:lysophospholipid acyltransferase (LPLAT)-like uncharacterized protein
VSEPAPPRVVLPWHVRALIVVGAVALRVLAATWRVRVVNRDAFDAYRRTGRPLIFAHWHGQMLATIAQHRGEGVALLVSEHRDGEIIARVAQRLGLRAIRGSTSRGGGRALLAIIAELKRGGEVAITPDGPRGPRQRFAPGALVAAQRSGAPVCLLYAHPAHAWRLRSWDRFEIPKPFSRITIAYAAPVFVSATSARDAAAEAPAFEQRLAELARLAERARLAGG